ncbi:MAG: hypothetical protein ACRDY6_18475 [Acidimicrobiia bacterium]
MSPTTALLIGVVLVAALACPAMMWFQARRGKSAPCCPPTRDDDRGPADLDRLRAEHERLNARLAELESRPEDRERIVPG